MRRSYAPADQAQVLAHQRLLFVNEVQPLDKDDFPLVAVRRHDVVDVQAGPNPPTVMHLLTGEHRQWRRVGHTGLDADFCSCRYVCVTSLERTRIRPKVAQTLAQHSNICLTLGVYTHVELHDQTAAIEALPGPPGGGHREAAL